MLGASMFFLIPSRSVRVLATELLCLGAVMSVWVLLRFMSASRVRDESFSRTRVWRRMLPAALGYATLLVAGWNLRYGYDADIFDWFMLAMLLLLVTATAISWDLLVRVAEIKHSGVKATRGAGA